MSRLLACPEAVNRPARLEHIRLYLQTLEAATGCRVCRCTFTKDVVLIDPFGPCEPENLMVLCAECLIDYKALEVADAT